MSISEAMIKDSLYSDVKKIINLIKKDVGQDDIKRIEDDHEVLVKLSPEVRETVKCNCTVLKNTLSYLKKFNIPKEVRDMKLEKTAKRFASILDMPKV